MDYHSKTVFSKLFRQSARRESNIRIRKVPGVYGRGLAKLSRLLERLGDIPIEEGVKLLWDTKEAPIRQAFLEMSGWDQGWTLTEWARLPQSLREDLFKVRVVDALHRAEELLKKSG